MPQIIFLGNSLKIPPQMHFGIFAVGVEAGYAWV